MERLSLIGPELHNLHDVEHQGGGGPEYPQTSPEMGIAAGGLTKQIIQKDPYPGGYWDHDTTTVFNAQILSASMFEQITGFEAPACPINAATYKKYGLPFFDIPEPPPEIHGKFRKLKPLRELYYIGRNADIGSAASCEFFPVPEPIEEERNEAESNYQDDRTQQPTEGNLWDSDDDDNFAPLSNLPFGSSKTDVWNKLFYKGLTGNT